MTTTPSLFSIVLAAGDGTRLAPLVRRLHGDDRPKQFAALKGDRSLLQDTVDRMGSIAPLERTVVVVADRYLTLARRQLGPAPELVAQPRNVGTGPGILLPLAHLLARAPDATVVITPSDHHFRRPDRFVTRLSHAVRTAEDAPAGLCLVGVAAEAPSPDLGWIVPGGRVVARFVEKPSLPVARALYARGALWNTFVMVGRAESVWRLCARHLPRQVALFERYRAAVGTSRARALLETIYAEMPPADFSKDVLAPTRGLGVAAVAGSGWSDWGTPERVFQCPEAAPILRHLAMVPA